jgi:HlyD family secretion protein
MARAKKFTWRTTGVAVLVVVSAFVLWMAPSRQTSSAQDGARAAATPLIARGYTDAPAGTTVVAGDPNGGTNLVELRIKEGQKVKHDEIIAVLSNYPRADVVVRMSENNVTKLKLIHDTVLMGTRVNDIALLEATLKSSIESDKLQTLQRSRSGKAPDVKELEARLAAEGLEREKVRLELAKTTLKNDLAQLEYDIANSQATLENARRSREEALVRSPLDGVVVQIFSRQGELVSPAGIAKIVDMSQLRVLADVDELQVPRLASGAKVEVTFRGSPTVYKGAIARIAPTVKSMQRVEPNRASSTDARVVQVEIEFDDPSSMPQVLGREARVTFL